MNRQVEPIEYEDYGKSSMSKKTQKTLWILATIFGSIIKIMADFPVCFYQFFCIFCKKELIFQKKLYIMDW